MNGLATYPPPNISGISGAHQQPPFAAGVGKSQVGSQAGGDTFSDGKGTPPAAALAAGFTFQDQPSSFSAFGGGASSYVAGQLQSQQVGETIGQKLGDSFSEPGNLSGAVGGVVGGMARVGFSTPTPGAAGEAAGAGDWPALSAADFSRYQVQFQQADTDGDGRLSGADMFPVLMSLDAPKELLKDIWALADADKDGIISWPEFLVAMYLTERARDGRKPPTSLPHGPFPPIAQQEQQLQQDFGASGMKPQSTPTHGRIPSTDLYGGGIGQDGPSSSMIGTAITKGAMVGSGDGVFPMTAPMPGGSGGKMFHNRTKSGDFVFRGPGGFDIGSMTGPDAERVKSAYAEAEVADRELWEKELASSQAKANTVNLTQKLQELVLFRRRCEASLSEATDRAERAERDVDSLRKRVSDATSAVEKATAMLEASTSRTATAEVERSQLAARLEELLAEQASVTSGGGSTYVALQAELQSLRAQVSDAEGALAPHREQAAAAARQRMQLEMKLSELRMSAEGAAADASAQRTRIAQLEREIAMTSSGTNDGSEEAERAMFPSALQRIALAHDAALRRASELGIQPPPPPPSLVVALRGGGGLPVDLPTWGDWDDLEDEGFDTVQLAWGSWAREKPSQQQTLSEERQLGKSISIAESIITPSPTSLLQSVPQSMPNPQSLGGFGGTAGMTGVSVASSSIAQSAFDAFGAGSTDATKTTTGFGVSFQQHAQQDQTQGLGDAFGGNVDTSDGLQGAGETGGNDFSPSSIGLVQVGTGITRSLDFPTSGGAFGDWTVVSGGPTGGTTGAASFTGGSGVTAASGALPADLYGGASPSHEVDHRNSSSASNSMFGANLGATSSGFMPSPLETSALSQAKTQPKENHQVGYLGDFTATNGPFSADFNATTVAPVGAVTEGEAAGDPFASGSTTWAAF